jgi:hypothetical protein
MSNHDVRTVSTFWANIYVGLKETYVTKFIPDEPEINHIHHTMSEVSEVCRKYCDEKGFCVSVTPTNYIYTHGQEHGVIVGIINYPRFPSNDEILKARALELADLLRKEMGQKKVTVMMPSESIMLGQSQD